VSKKGIAERGLAGLEATISRVERRRQNQTRLIEKPGEDGNDAIPILNPAYDVKYCRKSV
jgi:hypothetical protein